MFVSAIACLERHTQDSLKSIQSGGGLRLDEGVTKLLPMLKKTLLAVLINETPFAPGTFEPAGRTKQTTRQESKEN